MDNPLAGDLDYILSQTKDLWEELRGKRIFITGGTGFFGSWLLESFCWANRALALNAEAWVLTRNPEAFEKKCPHLASDSSVKLYKGSAEMFDFPSGEFSHLIYAAVYNDAARHGIDSEILMVESMLKGLQHTLSFAVSHGVKKILLTSTGAIYGQPPRDQKHISEDFSGECDPSDTRNAYREIRRIMETICAVFAHRYMIETKIARGFAFIGPYLPLSGQFAAGNFIYDGLQGRMITVKGDGTPYRSYLYASDMAIWLWTILFCGKSCRPYNVGSEEAITIKDLAYGIAKAFSPYPAVVIRGSAARAPRVEYYVPDTTRACTELGLRQTISLAKGIDKTISWFRSVGF